MNQQDNGGISGTIMDITKHVGTSIFSFVFEQYLNIINYFLSSVHTQLAQIVPEESAAMDKYKQAQIMTAAINEIFNREDFKAQITAFATNIKATIEPFLKEINDLMAREGDALAISIRRIGENVTRDTINGMLDVAYGTLSSIPGIGTTIDLLGVIQAVVNSTSVITTEFLNNMTKVMSAFLNVYGETSGPIVDTIKSVEELFQTIKGMQDMVNSRVQEMQNVGKQLQLTARGGRKKKTIRKRGKVSI